MKDQQTGSADYSYWLMVRMWSANEAAALLLGYEPDYADFHYFDPRDHDPQELLHRKEIRNEWEKFANILESAQLAGELGKVELTKVGKPWGKTVTSTQWMNWAQRNNIECPAKLLGAFEEAKDRPEEEFGDIHPRTETSLLRVIGALLQELVDANGASQANIIRQIVDLHGHKAGISTSNLENCFANARRRLDDW